MKTKKALLVLIPILVVLLLILVGGYIFIKMNSTPDKIFNRAISSLLNTIKDRQQSSYSTIKGNLELSFGIESNDESLKSINKKIKDMQFAFDSEIDCKEALINQNINITKAEDDILNAKLLMQDEKVYIYSKDWFDKYIELPLEEESVEKIENALKNVNSINRTMLIEAVEQELKAQFLKQQFERTNTVLTINGQALKVKKSSLKLNEEQLLSIMKDLLLGLKNNNDFQTALGNSKDEINEQIAYGIQTIQEETPNNNKSITFSIYTKGIKNNFVALEIINQENENVLNDILFTKINENKNQFSISTIENGESKNILNGFSEKKDSEGIISISITNETETTAIVYKYNETSLQTNYELTIKNEETDLSINGGIIKTDDKYSGNFILVNQNKQNDKYNINGVYNIEFNSQIEKKEILDSVTVNELTEEEQQEIFNKVNSFDLYKLFEENQDIIEVLSNDNTENILNIENESKTKSTNTSITNRSYRIAYKEPEVYNVLLDGKGRKEYSDDKGNLVRFGFVTGFNDYIDEVEKKKTEDEDGITNVQISEPQIYKSKNNIEYTYRIITFEDNSGIEPKKDCVNLYFAHKIDDGSSFYLEMESMSGDFNMEDIDTFLNITIE